MTAPIGAPDDPAKEAPALNPNVTTIIGTVSTEPYALNDRGGRRRHAGFQVDVARSYWVPYLDERKEAHTVFEVRCKGYTAGRSLATLTAGARVVVVGHFEHGDDGSDLELHADVVAKALPDEPYEASEAEA